MTLRLVLIHLPSPTFFLWTMMRFLPRGASLIEPESLKPCPTYLLPTELT